MSRPGNQNSEWGQGWRPKGNIQIRASPGGCPGQACWGSLLPWVGSVLTAAPWGLQGLRALSPLLPGCPGDRLASASLSLGPLVPRRSGASPLSPATPQGLLVPCSLRAHLSSCQGSPVSSLSSRGHSRGPELTGVGAGGEEVMQAQSCRGWGAVPPLCDSAFQGACTPSLWVLGAGTGHGN